MNLEKKQNLAQRVGLVFLKLPQVRQRTGLSRSEIYRRVALGSFPRPVKLGERASAWAEHEIETWSAQRIAERDGDVR